MKSTARTTSLEIANIEKSFPGVLALSDVSIEFFPGEVHAIIGENGAGKSTLIKIITGVYKPDHGSIRVEGKDIVTMTPAMAMRNGIHAIYQENTLVPHLSISENISLSHMQNQKNNIFIDWKSIDSKAIEVLNYLGVDLNINKKAIDLDISEQQIVQIAKAISKKGDILILDEPTASFSSEEIKKLFDLIDTLRINGKCIIFISHHLDEVLNIADRITVLRDGLKIGTYHRGEVTQEMLITKMIGKKVEKNLLNEKSKFGPITLDVQKIHKEGALNNIQFQARAGEILGIYGIVGSGKTSLSRILFGREKSEVFDIKLKGKKIIIKSPGHAINNGVALIPEDRRKCGLIMNCSIKENIILPGLANIPGLFLKPRKIRDISKKFIQKFQIQAPNIDRKVKYLSGGNQQKVVFAKWIFADCDILILHEPTRGIDVGAKQQIYKLLSNLTKNGKTIILISSEIPELINLCNRVLILRSGNIVKEMSKNEIIKEDILRYALSEN